MKIPIIVRYRAFYLRHYKLRRFLPSWKVYVKPTKPMGTVEYWTQDWNSK